MDQILPLIVIGGTLIFVFIFLYYVPLGLWITAYFSGVKVAIFSDLVAMRLRKVPPAPIVKAAITAHKADLPLSVSKLEAHFLAGGNVNKVIQALISADKANLGLTFERAAAIDLAGRDVFEAVQISVNPKVIQTPIITAVAKDGIQVKVNARVTVRANLDRLVGGATEETILARVGEGIVTTVGSADDHKKVLENPDQISRVVLDRGLDSGTAFEILSIDIADVDVGNNIGAALQIDQAEADLKVARARAEERRAMAVAAEQENKAKIQEMQARVVEAEAEVPKAIAEAFRSGNLGIMDYYNMKNIMSDTEMRQSIAKGTDATDKIDDEPRRKK
ncbi:MAG: flotillin-like protein FloA [Candidatus Cyclonatronum sp.]|uniref:flotillin-like protein FloA n=1 Tax=Cyclonatronum sp. TaxID=3024185 RepID=UPI0025C5BD71|nr:flotillin-like protein FloA [Cyclonatronum sp.]MCC5934398.1 flotillin-like protein FloA [Balneolales bacterium]MCH8486973.1 flotillin-like protein FloA [Cyclonatronum sp.]